MSRVTLEGIGPNNSLSKREAIDTLLTCREGAMNAPTPESARSYIAAADASLNRVWGSGVFRPGRIPFPAIRISVEVPSNVTELPTAHHPLERTKRYLCGG